jgi:hypothetical protein
MPIQQTLTTSFKQQILLGQHDLQTDTLKLALYTAFATLGPDTTAYSSTNETTGTGYSAGGIVLTGVAISTASNGTVYVDFDNAVWNPAVFTCRGALIYNASKSNKSIAVLDFGADKTCANTFTVQMPENTSTAALLRFK